MVGLSLGEKLFIQGGIAQGLRTDGRKRLTYRSISVETGVIEQVNGSARVKMGATDVVASVKVSVLEILSVSRLPEISITTQVKMTRFWTDNVVAKLWLWHLLFPSASTNIE
ncbi:unnamed protein product [Thlaspi arvense]|uniref:Ribosomal RNA-processing protein 42 n=1 Tax=Thlaspi arvense TaxID=13288 RepID=A0AAU9SQ69_THLAR|nr:unnamed protein product [Thlaspi arvense]